MELNIFNYQDTPVRTATVEGEPWFVLADLCKVLGISDVSIVRRRLDDALCQAHPIQDSLGRSQQATIVSEAGMYEVVIRSDKQEAVAFRRWITGEVLPAIRKTGSYGEVAPSGERLLALAVVEAQQMLEQKDEQIAELAPKADAYSAFIDADGTYSIGSVAKMVGLSQNKLFDRLRNAGVLIAKGAMRNTPYQKYMHHFAVKAYDFERSDGTRSTSYTPRVQPSGVDFIRRKLGLVESGVAA